MELLRIPDLIAILLFMVSMAGVGVYFAKRNKSTEEYFLGNRSFPGWAVGLSLLGTSISSVTFLALPAAAYVLDYRQAVSNMVLPFVAVAAIFIFIPFFRRGHSTTAFEYLEKRYGAVVRFYAAASFVALQLLRLATVLYLVSIPVASMTGFSVVWVMIAGGIFIGFYTVLGGIEAVIWTDVVQTIILLGGGILCLVFIIYDLPGGFSEVFRVGAENHKFSLGPISWALNDRTFFVMLLLGAINFTTEYSSNQNVVQRYLAAKSMREARKATFICALMSIPTWAAFFFLGTCLFVFYRVFPTPEIANLSADEILPHFILTRIPAGIAGVIIAACLAAAMSSLDSSINAISTIGTVDFLKRYKPGLEDRYYLKWAKIFAVLAGVIMIAGAVVLYKIPKESMNDLAIIISSLFGGGILSIFMLGFFSKRVGNKAIIIGLASGLCLNLFLMFNYFGWLPESLTIQVHAYWTSIFVNLLLFVVAYVSSFIWPNEKELEGMTVWTMPESKQ
jgi:SSS family solute:Na+ symporter